MTAAPQIVPLWDVDAVCAYLGKSPSWVYHQAARGALPGAVRIGKSLRFHPDAVVEYAKPKAAVTLIGRK